jgi:predicted CXXCH cytochrome family protein
MKKVLALVAAAGIIAASSAAFGATIVNSKHDLAAGHSSSYAANSTQICVYCHAPHNAALSLPLWNRNNPTNTGFTLYSGVGMQNVSFQSGFTADSTSLFCMSCHDGNTAVGAVHNAGAIDGQTATGTTHLPKSGAFGASPISGSPANLGTNLSKTHPVNFPVGTVNNYQNDLWVGVGSHMGPADAKTGYSFGKTFPLFRTFVAGNASRTTANRSLECGSCHAVHDAEFSPFLRDTMNGSQLCLGCHNK